MPKAICAYTAATETYPEFLSVNQVVGRVEFTARGPALPPDINHPYTQCGQTVAMTMQPAHAVMIAQAIIAEYQPAEPPAEDTQREFIRGAQHCREAIAKAIPELADEIRALWSPFWGFDPGAPVPQARH